MSQKSRLPVPPENCHAPQAQHVLVVPDVGPDAWQDAADLARSFAERVLDQDHVAELRSVADLLDQLAQRGRLEPPKQRAIAGPEVGPNAWQDTADSVRTLAERVLDQDHVAELRSVADLLEQLAQRGRHR